GLAAPALDPPPDAGNPACSPARSSCGGLALMTLLPRYSWWALGACLLGGIGVAGAQQARDRRALRPLSTPAIEQRAHAHPRNPAYWRDLVNRSADEGRAADALAAALH